MGKEEVAKVFLDRLQISHEIKKISKISKLAIFRTEMVDGSHIHKLSWNIKVETDLFSFSQPDPENVTGWSEIGHE